MARTYVRDDEEKRKADGASNTQKASDHDHGNVVGLENGAPQQYTPL